MQTRVDSKSKLAQYASAKDYGSGREQPKKLPKGVQNKSNAKNKLPKNNSHSQSKLKPVAKFVGRNNENFNSINIVAEQPVKIKSSHQEIELPKKQAQREERSTRHSTERLFKSKSEIRFKCKSSRASPSPINPKEPLAQDKPKTQRHVTSRQENERKVFVKKDERSGMMKKSGSMATIQVKRENIERTHNNRVSVKTEGSSKMNSVIREDERQKKLRKLKKKKVKGVGVKKEGTVVGPGLKLAGLANKQKKNILEVKIQKSLLYSEVSFQQFCQEHPYESALVSNDRLVIPAGTGKMKTEGCQANILGQRMSGASVGAREMDAAVRIQKHFRGFITRKYIKQATFIIGKVKTIQTWWRRMLALISKPKKGKRLSIESSLITIKDFNQTIKTERFRNACESKDNTLSNQKSSHKSNIKDLIRNIMQEEEQSQLSVVLEKVPNQGLDHLESPARKVLTKEVYVEGKIKGQILSEKVFNSPKCLTSPNIARTPTNLTLTIKEFFNSSNEKQKIKEMLHSPRMQSPQPPKATPRSNRPEQEFELYPAQLQEVGPFDTQFGAIEEFCLLLVNFFRDRSQEMELFLERMEGLKEYRTRLTLRNWNSYRLAEEPLFGDDDTLLLDYEYLEQYERPAVFPAELREQILSFPEIEIALNDKHYDLESPQNRDVHRGFLDFVFDVIEEAFYQPYKYRVLEWNCSLSLLTFADPQTFFENLFATALGHIFSWGEIMCGVMLEPPEDQELQREARLKIMEKRVEHWDMGLGSRLGVKMEVAEAVVEELVEQLQAELAWLML